VHVRFRQRGGQFFEHKALGQRRPTLTLTYV
jgi:hypothetical protein